MKVCALASLWIVLSVFAVSARASDCTGDCDEDGIVRVDELVRLVNAAMWSPCAFEPWLCPPDSCLFEDRDGDGSITVAEFATAVARIVEAVNNALEGCPLWMQITPCRQCEPCDVLLDYILGAETVDETFARLLPDGVIMRDSSVEPVGPTCSMCGCPDEFTFRAFVRASDEARLVRAGWRADEQP